MVSIRSWLTFVLFAFATPIAGLQPAEASSSPPPADMRMPADEALISLRPNQGRIELPVTIVARESLHGLRIAYRSRPARGIDRQDSAVERHVVGDVDEGEIVERSLPITIRQHPQRIEIFLSAGDGDEIQIFDVDVLYQIGNRRNARLVSAHEFRRRVVERKGRALNEASGTDIRLLTGGLRPVSPARERLIQPGRLSGFVQALPGDTPTRLLPHIVDARPVSSPLRRATLRRSLPPSSPIPSIALNASGRVVYEDFYTNELAANPPRVLNPLSNATVELFQEADIPTDPPALIASAVTDANGNWSVIAAPAFDANPVFITVTTTGSAVEVADDQGNLYSWSSESEQGFYVNFGMLEITEDPEPAQVFAVMQRAWNYVVSIGGVDPGLIAASYPDTNCTNNGVPSMPR